EGASSSSPLSGRTRGHGTEFLSCRLMLGHVDLLLHALQEPVLHQDESRPGGHPSKPAEPEPDPLKASGLLEHWSPSLFEPSGSGPFCLPHMLERKISLAYCSVCLRVDVPAASPSGTRDRAGRVLLTISTCSPVWTDPDCESAKLLHLMRYYTSTLRYAQAMGLTVLVDARRAAPASAVFSALQTLQVRLDHREEGHMTREVSFLLQVEVLNSLTSLQRHVDLQQLPVELGGSFSFSQSNWISFRLVSNPPPHTHTPMFAQLSLRGLSIDFHSFLQPKPLS
uniref:Uncharacterized protein n=1 Tax=Xiphophorus maculatus TaxID=8083 RepID=A0A3B5R0M8_XIPMA